MGIDIISDTVKNNTLILQEIETFFRQHKLFHYKKRTLILYPHDTSSSVFYIKTGFLRVFRISEQGEELTLTILKPGDFFPLTYGIGQTSSPYYLETITPLELWNAPQEHFQTFIKTNPNIYYELTARIIVRFDGILTRMEYLVFSNAYTKVAATLLTCSKRFGEKMGKEIIIPIPLTHKDIATLIGITRETTSVEMKKLEKQGYIARHGRAIVIKQPELLEQQVLLNNEETPHLSDCL